MSDERIRHIINGLESFGAVVQAGLVDTDDSVDDNYTALITDLLHAAHDSGISVEILVARCLNRFNEEVN